MTKQLKALQSNFYYQPYSLNHQQPTLQSNDLGPWVQNRYKTIDQIKKITFDRHHLANRKVKNNTYLKLPLIASNGKDVKYYLQTKQDWSPMGLNIKRHEQNKQTIAISQSVDYRNRNLALSLDLLGKRKGRNTNFSIFGIPKSHIYI